MKIFILAPYRRQFLDWCIGMGLDPMDRRVIHVCAGPGGGRAVQGTFQPKYHIASSRGPGMAMAMEYLAICDGIPLSRDEVRAALEGTER